MASAAKRHRLKIKQHAADKKAAQKPPPDPYAPAVNAAVRAKYRPAQQELQGQIRASDQQQRNISGWYGDYLNRVQAAATQTAAGYSSAADRIGQTADTSQQNDRSARQQMIAQMTADAAKRGATVDPQIDATGAQAEASRRTGLDQAKAATLRTGADQNAYLADRSRIGAGQAVQAHTDESGRKRTLQQKKADLKLERADYAQTIRGTLQQQDFNQQVAEQGLGLKIKQLGVQAQNANTTAKLAQSTIGDRKHDNWLANLTLAERQAYHRKQNRLKAQGLSDAEAKDRAQRQLGVGPYKQTAPKGKKGTLTPAQRRTAQDAYSKALVLAGTVKPQRAHEQQAVQFLVDQKGVPALYARAAVQQAIYGGVGPKTRRKLRARGIHVNGFTVRGTTRGGVGAVAQGVNSAVRGG